MSPRSQDGRICTALIAAVRALLDEPDSGEIRMQPTVRMDSNRRDLDQVRVRVLTARAEYEVTVEQVRP